VRRFLFKEIGHRYHVKQNAGVEISKLKSRQHQAFRSSEVKKYKRKLCLGSAGGIVTTQGLGLHTNISLMMEDHPIGKIVPPSCSHFMIMSQRTIKKCPSLEQYARNKV
jgi:hypothetical protein